MVNLKKLIQKEAEKAILNKAVGKIIPMDGDAKPALGWKAKLAGALAVVATIAGMLSQYLAG
jgi:hypothetical protein